MDVVHYSSQELKRVLGGVNDTLLDLIIRVVESSFPAGEPTFELRRVKYGHDLIDHGSWRTDEDGDATQDDDLSPLCIVAEGTFEIYESEHDRHNTLQILGPGELFGVYEALDGLCEIPSSKIPASWSMMSGSKSIWSGFPIGNSRSRDTLRANINDLADKRIRKNTLDKLSFWETLKLINDLDPNGWHASYVVIPRSLIGVDTPEKIALTSYLYEQGWKQSYFQRVRNSNESFFRKHTTHPFAWVYSSINYIRHVGNKTRPAFVPYKMSENRHGPTALFDEMFPKGKHARFYIGPRYLNSGETGFLGLRDPRFPQAPALDRLKDPYRHFGPTRELVSSLFYDGNLDLLSVSDICFVHTFTGNTGRDWKEEIEHDDGRKMQLVMSAYDFNFKEHVPFGKHVWFARGSFFNHFARVVAA